MQLLVRGKCIPLKTQDIGGGGGVGFGRRGVCGASNSPTEAAALQPVNAAI